MGLSSLDHCLSNLEIVDVGRSHYGHLWAIGITVSCAHLRPCLTFQQTLKGDASCFKTECRKCKPFLRNANTADTQAIIATADDLGVGARIQVTVDTLGNLTIVDGEGNQISGSLQPIADDLALYGAGNTAQFADPCFGMFTFHISADASGRPVSGEVFVTFRRGAVLLALFSTAAPISPANPYNYLYGIALAEPTSYIRSGLLDSVSASTWSTPSNSGGVVGSSTDNTAAVPTALLGIPGAKHDGVSDDTAAIQAAVNSSHDVTFTDGVYMINADGAGGDSNGGGVTPQSNTIIRCSGNAVLQATTSRLTGYNVLRLNQVSNVKIYGCTIQGERSTHIGSSGEWGFGIGIWGSTDIDLENVTVKDCWGDGIYIMRVYSTTMRSQRIHGKNVVSTNNRRQAMSIIDGVDITFEGSYFLNANGTPPQAGIDVEPGGYGNAVEGFKCIECELIGNRERGSVAQSSSPGDLVNVQLIGGSSHDNADAGVAAISTVQSMLVQGVNIFDNAGPGVWGINIPNDLRRLHWLSCRERFLGDILVQWCVPMLP